MSVGDVIVSIELVHDVAKALKDTTGSSSHFIRLITELHGLERALLEVKGLRVAPEREPELAAIKQTVSQCQRTIQEFLSKSEKFYGTLREGGSQNRWKDALHKVEWQIFRKDEVESFRLKIQAYTASISLLLSPFLV